MARKKITDPFLYHQIQIAKKTMTLSDLGARILGGMTKPEAAILLKKHGYKLKKQP